MKTSIRPAQAGAPKGGTTGQVLAKNSSTDYDYDWVTPASGSLPSSISAAITSRNSSDELRFFAYKLGLTVFGIGISGTAQDGSTGLVPPINIPSGSIARLGGSSLTNLGYTAEFIANAFGYDINTPLYSTNCVIINSSGNAPDAKFSDLKFEPITVVTAGTPRNNNYEVDGVYVQAVSTVDEVVMITVSLGGTPISLFCKRKGNKYFDFFIDFSASSYSQYFLASASLADTFLVNLAAALGITPVSIDTSPGSGSWIRLTSSSTYTLGSGGWGVRLDAIYV